MEWCICIRPSIPKSEPEVERDVIEKTENARIYYVASHFLCYQSHQSPGLTLAPQIAGRKRVFAGPGTPTLPTLLFLNHSGSSGKQINSLGQWNAASMESDSLRILPMVLSDWRLTVRCTCGSHGGKRGGAASGRRLKALPIVCADGHNFVQAPGVQKVPGVLVISLDYVVQCVTGRGCSFNENISSWNCVGNYGNQIR